MTLAGTYYIINISGWTTWVIYGFMDLYDFMGQAFTLGGWFDASAKGLSVGLGAKAERQRQWMGDTAAATLC